MNRRDFLKLSSATLAALCVGIRPECVEPAAESEVSPAFVTYLAEMEKYIREQAGRMGLQPRAWEVVMHPDLWDEIAPVCHDLGLVACADDVIAVCATDAGEFQTDLYFQMVI